MPAAVKNRIRSSAQRTPGVPRHRQSSCHAEARQLPDEGGFTLLLPHGRSTERSCRAVVPRLRDEGGFTFLELLVVMGIIALLMVLVAPAFTSFKSAGDVTSAAYTVIGVLDTARTYAMANNTYTWVGFYEENTTDNAPTTNPPPYPGKGRVMLATIYSIDGTKIYDDTATSAPYPINSYKQLGKIVRIENVHVTDIGAPPSPTPNPTPFPNSLAARSGLPYTENAGTIPPGDHYNRISSDSSDGTKFTFSAQNYTFYKTVRFNSRGEVNINSTYDFKHVGEIGLRPSRGTVLATNSTNLVAIQFGGTNGNSAIYRQ